MMSEFLKCSYSAALLAVSTATCGRANLKTTGTEGAPCFANNTCFPDLLCSASKICVKPGCATGDGSCETNAPCPHGMVQVSDVLCIDQYEASVFENPDCTGQRYGAAFDDYPPGFTDDVSSIGCEGSPCAGIFPTLVAGNSPVACSVGGMVPSASITWFQAKRACENAGKFLCTGGDWYAACAGPDQIACPYGNRYLSGWCNGLGFYGEALPAGELQDCQGSVPGLFDMLGNLSEWTQNCVGQGCEFHSGSYLVDLSGITCTYVSSTLSTTSDVDRGFRCCLYLSP